MDKNKAKKLLNELIDYEIKGIRIESFINNGKSAAVYCGYKDNKPYALKIFDSDLIDNFGVEIQEKRIALELGLKNHNIKNLIHIIDGGKVKIKNEEYHYLIMDYIEGVNLKEYIETQIIDTKFIINIIKILLYTTEKLLLNDTPIAHRDIKPENIMIADTNEVFLMDLGVLKIIGFPSFTDVGQKQFLGTLRYAPPEFLTRVEEDSLNCWRAINIYQIGAVLHDLIMAKELFCDVEPYTNLVIAIKEDMPKIISEKFHPDLVQLSRNMLIKDWRKRLGLCPINKVHETLDKCLLPQDEPTNIFNDIRISTSKIRDELEEISKISRDLAEKEKIKSNLNIDIHKVISNCFNEIKLNETIDSIENSGVFKVRGWREKEFEVSSVFYKITGRFEFGFAKPVYILYRIENNENSFCKIMVIGIILGGFIKPDFQYPEKMLYDIFLPQIKFQKQRTYGQALKINFNCIFEGVFEPEDKTFIELISKKVALILKKAIEKMKPDIESELKKRKDMAGARPDIYTSISVLQDNTIINKF